MYFTPEALKALARDYQGVTEKHAKLMQAFVDREYKEARAKEFAQHGFMRRIKSMARSIANVFTLLPPEYDGVPDSEVRHDAEINIQAFLFNTFAATDNLAWVWVAEKNIKKPDGTDIPYGQVGLRKDRVLASFSPDFREYLQSREPWFDHLEEFRHALAHRIPLYIPPYSVDPKDEQAYRELEAAMNDAARRGDFKEYDRAKTEQRKLAFFRPWMTHSYIEKAKIVVFHSQLLADFNTIDEMAWKMLEELERQQPLAGLPALGSNSSAATNP
jgi:hypothetical protein